MENTNFQLQETLDKLQENCPLADLHAPYLIKKLSFFSCEPNNFIHLSDILWPLTLMQFYSRFVLIIIKKLVEIILVKNHFSKCAFWQRLLAKLTICKMASLKERNLWKSAKRIFTKKHICQNAHCQNAHCQNAHLLKCSFAKMLICQNAHS